MRLSFLLFTLLFTVSCSREPVPEQPVPGEPDVEEPSAPEEAPPPVRILAIGNSFSADAVHQNLWNLFDAAGLEAVVANLYAPGSYLSHHWERAVSQAPEYKYVKVVEGLEHVQEEVSFDVALGDEPWDFISLQQASDKSGLKESYQPYLSQLVSYIRERRDAEIVFHQTWAYPQHSDQAAFSYYGNDQWTMYQAIMDAVQEVVVPAGIERIIPTGTAVQNARTSYLGDTLNRDGLHLNLEYGRYLAACVWFETLSGQSVVGNPYHPASISDKLALLCQTAAHLACQHPYEVTPMTDFH